MATPTQTHPIGAGNASGSTVGVPKKDGGSSNLGTFGVCLLMISVASCLVF